MSIIGNYFRNLYQRTMREAYQLSDDEIVLALRYLEMLGFGKFSVRVAA